MSSTAQDNCRVWTDGYEDADCLVINLSHHHQKAAFVTFWRPDNNGYAFPLAWAGLYAREEVDKQLDYYHTGHCHIAIPAAAVEGLLVSPGHRMIDNDAGPVMLSTKENWGHILRSLIRPVATPTASRLCNKSIPAWAWQPLASVADRRDVERAL